ncbi:MAG: C-terminal binding protein [Ruminococcaceae bacterium]|nr:C-terminal binding protein [Oscillospiraceae bacterium]
MKIVMLDRMGTDFSLEKKVFRDAGATFLVTYFRNADELRDIVRDADILMFNDAHITAEIIAALDKCKMIIRYGIGYDNVDLEAAGRKGIFVCNAPSYGTYDVAEHTMALLLSVCKHIPLADKCARTGQWNADRVGKARRLCGKTLGLVGFGRIAHMVATRARAFEMEILIYDPYVDSSDAAAMGVTAVDFPTLLERADYVSLHSPLNAETHHMMGMPQFKLMKKDAVLINTGRGGLINENEMIFALLSGEIAGAALDVFETEPLPASSKLLQMENVVLSPHVAWNSYEGTHDLHVEVTENVLRVLRGETPINIVNRKFLRSVY